MQTISSKYLGATNFNNDRIRATSSGRCGVTTNFDHGLSVIENHKSAVIALATKLQWDGDMVGGITKEGDMVWVFTNDTLISLPTLQEDNS